MKTKTTWGDIAILLAVIIVVVMIIIGIWKIERAVNYKFGYENDVKQTIRDLVKPECLKP